MATTRKYSDGCAAAHALNLVGERWALLVVRELLLGPKRFTELRRGLPDISPNVLSQRLSELESAAVVRRTRGPALTSPPAYALTPWGLDLGPIVMALGRWGARSPALPRGLPLGADSLVLSFRTLFDPHRARGVSLSLELRLGDQRFAVAVADEALSIVRGDPAAPDAVLAADDPGALAAIAYDGASLADARRDGTVQVTGDLAAARRFFKLFALPDGAAAAEAASSGNVTAGGDAAPDPRPAA